MPRKEWTREFAESADLNTYLMNQVVQQFASTASRATAIPEPGVSMISRITSNDANEGIEEYNSAGEWRKPWNLPWGYIAHAEFTSTLGSVTTIQDITNLTITYTAVANRRVRIYGEVLVRSSASADLIGLHIYVSGPSQIQQANAVAPAGSADVKVTASVIESPAAGEITYWLRASRLTGSGSLTVVGNSQYPCYILVEDIGPAGAPA